MVIRNLRIYTGERKFIPGSIRIKNGRFASVSFRGEAGSEADTGSWAGAGEEVLDGKGCYAIPGLVDIHFHGCAGYDLCDADEEAIARMARYEASVGVTSICPATMTLPEEQLHEVMRAAGRYEGTDGARFQGIHMEGPFLSKGKRGAQAEAYIRKCDVDLFRSLQGDARGKIRIVDIAPETEGAMDFIDAVKAETVVSIAHTEADYDTAVEAFRRGARHVTHLFNAMPPLHHRNPGVIGAAGDCEDCCVELICDGIHVHPSVVRAAFARFGPDRIVLVSDSMRAAGLGDGTYTLGGQKVLVRGALATLEDGQIAGSVMNLMDCLRTAVREMGIPLEDAVGCATANPAQVIGIYDRCGSIRPGKQADLVLLDRELCLQDVFIGGIRQ